METYKVIGDVGELKWFYEHIVEKPLDGESYMFCNSARAKKLTEEEKENFGAKRAEMFHTEVSKVHIDEEYSWIDFLSAVSKFEVNKLAYLTKKKLPYPDKSLVLYMYMNPSSEAACAQDTLERINVINKELINSGLKGSMIGIKDSIWKLSTISNHIKACHAQNPARRVYIDFDIDCKDLDDRAIDIINTNTKNYFGKGFLVRTSGGIHVLVRKEALKFNPNNYIEALTNDLKEDYTIDEIKKNDNCMIPVPGTLQYGNIVRVINKGEF